SDRYADERSFGAGLGAGLTGGGAGFGPRRRCSSLLKSAQFTSTCPAFALDAPPCSHQTKDSGTLLRVEIWWTNSPHANERRPSPQACACPPSWWPTNPAPPSI